MTQSTQIDVDASDGLAWLTRPYTFLRERAATHGDTFVANLGRYGRYVLFSNPADVREIFSLGSEILHAGQGNAVLKSFLGAGSLLLLEEELQHRERRLLQPGFAAARLATHVHHIERVANLHIDRLEVGTTVRAQELMQDITLEVIFGLVFGDVPHPSHDVLQCRLSAFLNDTKFNLALISELHESLGASPAWAKFRESLGVIRAMLADEVARRRASPTPGGDDLLSMLVVAKYADGDAISDEHLVDELLTIIVTGYETTATALAWALYWVHRDPRVARDLGERARAIAPTDAHKDPYLTALCREVLRIHPVIPVVARKVRVPVTIGGKTYDVGTIVAPCIYLTHHRPDLYPEPDTFRPERFLERTYTASEYYPFGGGARKCLGMGLAMMEMAIVLCVVTRRLDLELLHAEKLAPQRRSVTVAPSLGTPLRVLSKASYGVVS